MNEHGILNPARMRGARERLGLSRQQLAEQLGVSRQTVTRWEEGKQVIHPEGAIKYALAWLLVCIPPERADAC